MRRFTIESGGGIPNHTNTVEHEQYVLRGHAMVGINGEEFEVRAEDVLLIPEGAPHWYQNVGDGNFEFLCLIPNKTNVIKIVDEKMLVKHHNGFLPGMPGLRGYFIGVAAILSTTTR